LRAENEAAIVEVEKKFMATLRNALKASEERRSLYCERSAEIARSFGGYVGQIRDFEDPSIAKLQQRLVELDAHD
jgi:hypothetical protein